MEERKKRKLGRLLAIANADLALFKSLAHTLLELYDNRIIRLVFAGAWTGAQISRKNIKLLMEKFNLDETKLSNLIESFVFGAHFVIRKEDDDMCEWLKENKDAKTADKLREKLDAVSEVVNKHPLLRQGYLVYTFSKLYHFDDMEWEADLKVFQSPSPFLETEETPLVFPSARLRIILRAPAISPVEPRSKSFEFEISAKDLDFLIRSLQDMGEALRNLKAKKLAD